MDNAEVSRKSENIFQNLKETPFFRSASCIGLFSPIRNEVRTEKIFHLARKLRKKVGFPLTMTSEKKLLFFEVTDLNDLTIKTFGIKEPPFVEKNLISRDNFDLLIVPGLAFELIGYRVGYGGGFYDRFVSEEGFNAVKVSLAFDLQIVEKVPKEPHDVKVDYIITESRMIECL